MDASSAQPAAAPEPFVPPSGFPRDWYWLAEDGRVYASGRQAITVAGDPAYVDWLAAGNRATAWPRDEVGAQTSASLQDVLTPYGLWIDLSAYAAAKRYALETGGIVVAGAPIATDRQSQAMVGNAYTYVQVSGAATVSYKTAAGFVTLTADQIKAVALAVGAHVQACFAAEDRVDASIHANPATITTLAQVDAAFASLAAG